MKGTSELADKLEQLEEKATGAPWYDEMGIIVDNPDEMKGRRVLPEVYDMEYEGTDVAFVIMMRNNLPIILDALRGRTGEPTEENDMREARIKRSQLNNMLHEEKRATPAPWFFGKDGEVWGPDETRVATPGEWGRTKEEADANGNLIAMMRTHFAALLHGAWDKTLVPGLEKANREAHQAIARLKNKIKKLEQENAILRAKAELNTGS